MRTEAEYAEIEKLAGKETVEALKESDAERDEKLKEIRSLKEALLQMNAADVGNAFKQVLAYDLNISRDIRPQSDAELDALCAITKIQLLELET